MEHNIFREIEDDLAQQKYEELWKRYGGLIIGVALTVVLITAVLSWWHSRNDAQNRQATTALFNIVDSSAEGDVLSKQIDALDKLSGTAFGAHRTLARLDAAALEDKTGDRNKAAQMYDAIANDTGVDTVYRQFATLMSVREQMDNGNPAELEKRLEPLVTDDVPWHYTALEYQAFLAIKMGEKEKAAQIFTVLSQDARAPHSLSGLAADMLHYLSE